MEVYVHDIKFEEKNDFTRRFNRVSDLYQEYKDVPEDQKEQAWENFWQAKYCLEQGIGL